MTHHIQKTTISASNVFAGVNRRKTLGRMFLPALMVGAILPIVGLSGCAKHSKDQFVVGSTPPGTYKTRHPIVLGEREQVLDVPVSSQSTGLPLASASAVRGFTSSYKKSAGGVMTIMLPAGSPNQRAARRISNRVADVVISQGVPASRISITTYDAHNHGSAAPIRLSYGAVTASVGECGAWDKDLSDNHENRNYKNYGCATQSNLAAIVSNPADLLGPRGTTGIDAARRGKVIEDYRSGDRTQSTSEFPPITSVFATE